MTLQQVVSSLLDVGASEIEAADLAHVMMLNGWNLVSLKAEDRVKNARRYLNDWRIDKRATACIVRRNRQERIDAGYRSVPVSDPVFLNGKTAW
jgi:hypothetical protein